ASVLREIIVASLPEGDLWKSHHGRRLLFQLRQLNGIGSSPLVCGRPKPLICGAGVPPVQAAEAAAPQTGYQRTGVPRSAGRRRSIIADTSSPGETWRNHMAALTPLQSLVATGTKLWLDSVDPQEVAANRAFGATGATSNPIIIADLIK